MGLVIGTAGHIDHGKTALVRALTGQDTDRLKAEKERGISIDLGFAHFDLPNGTRVGVVDVPGHEKFIRNMAAGAHALDLVLFVVAADDGVMPQSEEHFDIVRALGVEKILFVITKSDKVSEDRIIEVGEEIGILIDGSRFERAEIVAVSNISGDGIEALKSRIGDLVETAGKRSALGWFRMPIDRVFSVHGRGVVVTGTVLSGALKIEDEIVIAPTGTRFRVRGLHRHDSEVTRGRAGDRLAINLAGADRHSLRRGDVVCAPAIARASRRIDVTLSVSPHAKADLSPGQRVRLHTGTAEGFGSVKLAGKSRLIAKGETGQGQIRLTDPVHVMARDHFVIRDEQAENTLGGGQVLDPVGARIGDGEAWQAQLSALANGELFQAVELLIADLPGAGIPESDLVFRLNMPKDVFIKGVTVSENLIRLKSGADVWITGRGAVRRVHGQVLTALSEHHAAEPASPGISTEALHNLIARTVDPGLFRALIDLAVNADALKRDGAILAMPSHDAGLSDTQQRRASELLDAMNAQPFSPPQPDRKDKEVAIIATHMERQGDMVRAGQGLFFAKSAYAKADEMLEAHLDAHASISVAEFRDLLGTTRKFALALLESFDRTGRTVRQGEVRKKGKPLE